MYFDTAEGSVFRPPSEANSLIIRVTIGCSHNRCTYCNMYRDVAFRIRPMDEIMQQINRAKPYSNYVRRIFLADGNALVLKTDTLIQIINVLQQSFPRLQRIACYAGPQDILRKSLAELKQLREAGLKLVYYGMESGDDSVLTHVCKGVSGQQSIEAGQKIVASGIKLSLMIILGLAGKSGSSRHAYNTAQAINAINPNMLSALTLMLYRGSELLEEYERGKFEILSPAEIMNELYEIIANIKLSPEYHCLFRSNHISNHVSFAATLPKDKQKLLEQIQQSASELSQLKHWDPYNNVEG